MYFIFLIVGFLQQHGYAVREFQFGVTKLRTAFLTYNLAGFRHFGDDGFVLHVVYVSREVGGACLSNGRQQTFLGGISKSVFLGVEVHDNQVGVRLRHEFGKHLVNILQWNVGNHLLHRLVVVFDGRDGFVIEEVLFVALGELRSETLFAVAEHAVERAERRGLRTVVLGLCKAKLGSSQRLDIGRFQCFGR